MPPWEKAALWLTIGLTAAVLVKLGVTGLIKIYRLLFCYLLLDFVTSIASFSIPHNTNAYGYYYFVAQTLKFGVAAFVLMEIYALALESTPALARFGRNSVGYIVAGAAVFPFALLWMDRSLYSGRHPFIRAFFLFEQTTDGTMAVFLILISMFIAWFPVKLRKNVIMYIGGIIAWWLSRFASVHFVNQQFMNRRIRVASDTAQILIETGCLVLWLIGMKRQGEARTAVVGHLWNRREAERLTEQLNALNDGLARLRRK
jgi:hypothetical protein